MQAEKASFPIDFMAHHFGVSRSGYYAWVHRRPSKRAQEDILLTEKIRRIHQESRQTYGSPRIRAALCREGAQHSRKRVIRLMRLEGMKGRIPKAFRRTTDSKHAFPVADNVLARDFVVDAPNVAWVTDITYISTNEGWLYLAAILDLYSRRVVGWEVRGDMETELCLSALDTAIEARRPPAGLIHHSDRGSQYASTLYRQRLDAHGIVCSMSRKADCWDNAVAESFWSTLKMELVYRTSFPTKAAARLAIFEFIEVFYNRRRLHSHLGYRSPVAFEALASNQPLAA
jgi:putative transposase